MFWVLDLSQQFDLTRMFSGLLNHVILRRMFANSSIFNTSASHNQNSQQHPLMRCFHLCRYRGIRRRLTTTLDDFQSSRSQQGRNQICSLQLILLPAKGLPRSLRWRLRIALIQSSVSLAQLRRWMYPWLLSHEDPSLEMSHNQSHQICVLVARFNGPRLAPNSAPCKTPSASLDLRPAHHSSDPRLEHAHQSSGRHLEFLIDASQASPWQELMRICCHQSLTSEMIWHQLWMKSTMLAGWRNVKRRCFGMNGMKTISV